ncbi:golgin subfamily A member 4 [Aedes albopictus]|uniref:Uncharacterized protein n=1 Tax=Aedes albopictus TaxID=7160 RepID=A0ABM1YQR3_AEDAL
MSASKTEPKVMKKQIQSKIESGVPKKPSTLTLIKSRQPSTLSRASSRQSSSDKKPLNAPSSKGHPRPNTSFTSTRIPQTSKINLAIADRVQQGVHRLGKLPSYLRSNNRPATASSKLRQTESETKRKQEPSKEDKEVAKRVLELQGERHQKFKNNLAAQFGQYATSKKMLDGLEQKPSRLDTTGEEPNVSSVGRPTNLEQAIAKICTEMDQNELGDTVMEEVCPPPCEGHRSAGDAALQEAATIGKRMELEELCEKMRQFQKKCEQHEADSKVKQERIVELEMELAGKCEAMEKLQNHIENAKLISSSRVSITQDNIKELNQSLKNVRLELLQKCDDLVRSDNKVFVLNARVDELKRIMSELEEEHGNRIFELTEKEAKQQTELDVVNRRCEELTQQLTNAKEEATAKDSLNIETETEDPIKSTLALELEAKRTEIATLRKETQKLRYENDRLSSAKKRDDVLFDIRKKLLQSIEGSKEAFKAQCDELSSFEGDAEADKEHTRTRNVLFKTMAEKQRRCCREQQIISELGQNSQKCKAVRNSLLHMVKRYKKENRQMREIIRMQCGDTVLVEPFEEPIKDDRSLLKREMVDCMYQLFPAVPVCELANEDYQDGKEKIVSKVIYNQEILSEHERGEKTQAN